MILADTSAWVEFLRNTDSAVCQRVDDLLDDQLVTCEVVRMEVLAGGRDELHVEQLRGLLARARPVATEPIDFEVAAALYRACRRAGKTVRQLNDCLVAAQAIRLDLPVLHQDADFDVLAEHTGLRLA